MEEMVTITKSEYYILQGGAKFVECLKECGVENWEGFSDALLMFYEYLQQIECEEDCSCEEQNCDNKEE